MDLRKAEDICSRALEVGRLNNLKPLTIAVLDAGGHLICFKKEDGASLFREAVARGKAMGALGFGMDSAGIAAMAEARPAFINSAFAATGGHLIPVPGGVLIRDANRNIIGAAGISGDLSESDEACAIAGIKAAGLICDAVLDDRECFLKAHL
mmetsp:Transcript_20746/g.34269  ORF Transcript_20746/g.34269 Transcript_20746/m.34269 type:complete len:153 (+) Transcript_20746:56-514(+)